MPETKPTPHLQRLHEAGRNTRTSAPGDPRAGRPPGILVGVKQAAPLRRAQAEAGPTDGKAISHLRSLAAPLGPGLAVILLFKCRNRDAC